MLNGCIVVRRRFSIDFLHNIRSYWNHVSIISYCVMDKSFLEESNLTLNIRRGDPGCTLVAVPKLFLNLRFTPENKMTEEMVLDILIICS